MGICNRCKENVETCMAEECQKKLGKTFYCCDDDSSRIAGVVLHFHSKKCIPQTRIRKAKMLNSLPTLKSRVSLEAT